MKLVGYTDRFQHPLINRTPLIKGSEPDMAYITDSTAMLSGAFQVPIFSNNGFV